MQRGVRAEGWSVALLAIALTCAWQAPVYAAQHDEEPLDLGSYDPQQNRTVIERPTITVQRPEIRPQFDVQIAPPQTTPTLPTLYLNDALMQPPAQPTPAAPQRQSSPPPAVAQERPLGSAPPSTQPQPSTPPPSRPAAASSGPRIVPVSMEPPSYPVDAQRSGAEGYVTVAFTIKTDGSVDDIEVIEDQPRGVFRRDTLRAVRRWQFQPIMVDGRATEYRVQHRIDFNLDDG